MHDLARVLLLGCLGTFAVSLGFMAVARPALPERIAHYGLAIRLLGRWLYWWSAPLVRFLDAHGFRADHVTFLGCALTGVAALLAAQGWWGLAGLALMLGGLCDLLDGELARRQRAEHPAGAFLDSSLDRVSEILLFGGMAWGFPDRLGAASAFAALGASFMVSYARARGEGLGVACPGGGLERPHRVLILMFTLLFSALFPERWAAPAAAVACAVVAVGAAFTAGVRLWALYRLLRHEERPTPLPEAQLSASPPPRGAPGVR
jgi:CDP-diacylglycerol--glycerol-3-phosphate 3-phosphatidyltransferase